MTTLYTCWSEAGEMLYVGISKRIDVRLCEHETDDWWKDVESIELTYFTTRRQASRVERAIIRTNHPKHNVQHNGCRNTYPIRGSKDIPADAVAQCRAGACVAMVARARGLDYTALRAATRRTQEAA